MGGVVPRRRDGRGGLEVSENGRMSLSGEKGEDEDESGGTGKDELVASPVPFLRVGSVMGSEAGLHPPKVTPLLADSVSVSHLHDWLRAEQAGWIPKVLKYMVRQRNSCYYS
jgi:hypothetical protein